MITNDALSYHEFSGNIEKGRDREKGKDRDRSFRFMEMSRELLAVMDFEGFFTYANRAFSAVLGFNTDEMLRIPWWDLVHPDDHADSRRIYLELKTSGARQEMVVRARHKDGSYRVLKCQFHSEIADGLIYTIARDVSRLRETQALLNSESDIFRLVVEGSFQGIVLHQDLRPLYANQSFAGIFGFSSPQEVLELDSLSGLFSPGNMPAFRTDRPGNVKTPAEMYNGEIHATSLDGKHLLLRYSSRQVEWDGKTAALLTISNIAGPGEDAESNLELQRLEAVGRLAGGVAHNLNNRLQMVQANCALTLDESTIPASVEKNMHSALQAIQSSVSMVRRLLSFGRQELLNKREYSLADFVLERTKTIQNILGPRIDLFLTLAWAPKVKVDLDVLESLLLELCTNAREAMPGGGRLEIGTSLTEVTGEFKKQHPWIKARRLTTLTVCDNGSGIADIIRDRLFDPFFTTKEPYRGAGLGLSMAYGAARQHGGTITFSSKPDKGTTFVVYLPACD
ncbi:MAG: PAS domain S-box protein [Deltaproteobacteria bacterium]|nr:PAS domain S-box protein [Deltaproteobacteria bacterium]